MQSTTSPLSADKSRYARIELKTSPEVKMTLEQAASETGVSLTAFILNQAIEQARNVLESRQVTRLHEASWNALNKVISNPEPATDALIDLMHLKD